MAAAVAELTHVRSLVPARLCSASAADMAPQQLRAVAAGCYWQAYSQSAAEEVDAGSR